MRFDELPDDARELLALFLLGALLGLVAAWIVEAWIVAADLGDRARIREELERWRAELELEHRRGAVELPGLVAAISRKIDSPALVGETFRPTAQASE
jgi:hypothetical protein